MKIKLQYIGLSKDILNYWNEIGFKLNPDQLAMIISDFGKLSLYHRISLLSQLLDEKVLSSKYTEYCKNFIDDYNMNVEKFKTLDEMEFYSSIYNISDSLFRYTYGASKDFESILNYGRENSINGIFTISKNNMLEKGTDIDEYDYNSEYIVFDTDLNIIDACFNNIRYIPIEDIIIPTNLKYDEVYKFSYDADFNTIIIGLDSPESIDDNGYYTLRQNSGTDKSANAYYYDRNTGKFMYDHISAIYLEKITDSDIYDLMYSPVKDLIIKYRHDSKMLIEKIQEMT